MNIQGWFPSRLTGLISLLSKGLSRIFTITTVWRHQFFSTQPSLWSISHIQTWIFVSKVIQLYIYLFFFKFYSCVVTEYWVEFPVLYTSLLFSRSVVSNSLRPHDGTRPAFLVLHHLPELVELMSTDLVMPSNHFICRPLLFLPSIFRHQGLFS